MNIFYSLRAQIQGSCHKNINSASTCIHDAIYADAQQQQCTLLLAKNDVI